MADSRTESEYKNAAAPRSAADVAALSLATWGVGFIPLAPGTWGSAVGVGLYLLWEKLQSFALASPANGGSPTGLGMAVNTLAFLAICLSGIWAAGRTARILGTKDPQKVVGDEVMGQILTYMFVPFGSSWKVILAGFIFFRLFDIVKPYPIRKLEKLGGGLGICADDLAAGLLAGMVTFIFATFVF